MEGNKKELLGNKRDRFILAVFLLFGISVIFRFLMADYFHVISVYPDEQRYYAYAEGIATGRGISIHNVAMPFQKILYSVLLAPAFILKDRTMQMHLIALINAVIVSMSVFPAYFLAKRHITDRKYQLLSCGLTLILSDLAYSMFYMSEVCFLGLGIWGVLYADILLSETSGHSCGKSAFFGFLLYLLYLCKEVALVFLLAYLFEQVLRFLRKESGEKRKGIIWESMLVVGVFSLCFVLMKLTIFSGMGNSYHQTDLSIFNEPARIKYMIECFFNYFVYAVLACGFFPMVLPLVEYFKLPKQIQVLYRYLMELLALSSAVTAFTIRAREDYDFGVAYTRADLRYITYLWAPLIIVLFAVLTKNTKMKIRHCVEVIIIGCGIAFVFRGIAEISALDEMILKYLISMDQSNMLSVRIGIALAVVIGVCLLLKNRRALLLVFSLVFICLQLWNTSIVSVLAADTNRVSSEELQNTEETADFINAHSKETFLLVGDVMENDRITQLRDTYLNLPNVYATSCQVLLLVQEEAGTNLDSKKLMTDFWPGAAAYTLKEVDYILARKDMEIVFESSSCTFDSEVGYYDIYKVTNPKVLPKLKETKAQLEEEQQEYIMERVK